MAKFQEDRYFKRSGNSFYRMEHFDIADMFSRRGSPKLIITTKVATQGGQLGVVLSLRNEGRASARAPFIVFSCSGPMKRSIYGVDGGGNEGMPRIPTGYTLDNRYGSSDAVVIHPGVTLDVTRIDLPMQYNGPMPTEVTIDYGICCESMPMEQGSITVDLT
jgi:hypothetical protein